MLKIAYIGPAYVKWILGILKSRHIGSHKLDFAFPYHPLYFQLRPRFQCDALL